MNILPLYNKVLLCPGCAEGWLFSFDPCASLGKRCLFLPGSTADLPSFDSSMPTSWGAAVFFTTGIFHLFVQPWAGAVAGCLDITGMLPMCAKPRRGLPGQSILLTGTLQLATAW